MALPNCDRHDAVGVLTDGVHYARASEYNEEDHVAVAAAVRGQHTEAAGTGSNEIPTALGRGVHTTTLAGSSGVQYKV
ncbi:hypothetical protein Pcinc_026534 [Petrolisthes cinctipes]|uniref:Uncharacterized protein n=1 Tax=Petrolisthes cinctipes TaxID=88211 RepID=A0AAE1KBI1_PETCI|nr:hypothetical protein Pcinc_026534 [Petrolisthes cinctipes]